MSYMWGETVRCCKAGIIHMGCFESSTAKLSELLSYLAEAWVNLGTEWCWQKRRNSFKEAARRLLGQQLHGQRGLSRMTEGIVSHFLPSPTPSTGESQQLQWAVQKFSVCLGVASLRLVVQLNSWTSCTPVLSAESFTGHVQENYYGKDLELFRGRNWFQMMPCWGFIVFFRQGIK